jgi:nicotinate-nucleotide adenylyltransferase
MKIGIFGGSFSPIHMGHLVIAEFIRSEKNLDKVLFIPLGIPSHREDDLASVDDRINMVKLAIKSNSHFEMLDIEAKKKAKSYTVDTLRELKKIYPDDVFFEIIGEDSACYLNSWKEYEALIEETKFFVFRRNGYSYDLGLKNVEVVDTPLIDISSTVIRQRIIENKSIKYLVPEEVEEYIKKNKIFV